MAAHKGHPKYGGRKKGTPNKSTALQDVLARIGLDPFEVLAQIASGDVVCGTCHGKGKTKFQPADPDGDPGERVCQSCWGEGKERVTTGDRFKAAAELSQYLKPKLRAMEHTGADGAPIQHAHTITFVE